ncbi:hypothetical protein [Pelagicoccus sp. SDUM812002]|uniref:hypothetical protein n=1 Tax=Pelagicoccus sp. SDUM812002 TaxID=3041266 RepID=UPI00280DA23D|nr:hypothetical protein [Pelagicoccus sp. SDUM812002]MDQ8184286.1 hypothetical protein [Pelagicoccus sp. SDUM812002]
MPKSPRRKFNADRFLDKFKCFEGVLRRYCDQWKEGLDGFPEMLTVETFKDWLRYSAGNRLAYKGMLEGIYRAYDLSTKQGQEILMDALEQFGVEIPGVHSLHVEVLALRVLSEFPEVFEVAYDTLTVSRVDKFTMFRGKEARELEALEEGTERFAKALRKAFAVRKGTEKVLVKRFTDGDVQNFIVYHEERVQAVLEMKENGETIDIQPLIFRPVKQDFIAYFPRFGKIEIESTTKRDTSILRTTFGKVFLDDPEFFDSEESETLINLERLKDPAFVFDLESGHYASLTDVRCQFGGKEAHRVDFNSKDVFQTLEKLNLRPSLGEARLASAKIKIVFPECRRGKTVTLSDSNKISFNRSTRSMEVFRYLRRWGLLSA